MGPPNSAQAQSPSFSAASETNLFTIPHLSFTHSLTRCWQGRGLDSLDEHYLPHHRSVRPPPSSWRGLATPSFWSFRHFFDLFAILGILQQTFRFLLVSASSENTDCRKYGPHKNTDPIQHKTAKIPLLGGARKEKHDKIPIFLWHTWLFFYSHWRHKSERTTSIYCDFFSKDQSPPKRSENMLVICSEFFLFGRSPRLISFQASQGSISGLF